LSFGSTAPWTVGVEEELVLVDPETLQPAPVFERGLAVPERLKAELFACLVEAATPVCRDAAQALDSLVCLRREAANRAARAGARLVAIGIHPLARSHGQPIVCEPRYEEMVAKLGDAVYRQLVCGLHVHVGVASEEACLRALEGVLPWLPTLIALAANSPFAEGADTGCRSARIGRLGELPGGGRPPVLRRWSDWEAAVAGRDYTRLWWDVRPHPRYGTLEVRVADQQTSVQRSAGFAALAQALVATAAEEDPEPVDRACYLAERRRAAVQPPHPAAVAALRGLVEPAARALGGWPLVEKLLAGRPEAEGQLEAGPVGALRHAAERTLVLEPSWASAPRPSG